MFWIALKLTIPKIGLNVMLSLPVKEVDAFDYDGVAESDNTVWAFFEDEPINITGMKRSC